MMVVCPVEGNARDISLIYDSLSDIFRCRGTWLHLDIRLLYKGVKTSDDLLVESFMCLVLFRLG
jgi:hypothetical protein